MAVWYLDNDDEITDAVARLRGSEDERVVFVVPPGSRIATGRINFKLLAREATTRGLRMAVASPDEQVRAMAASAGVLACATPDEAEAALARGDEPPAAPVPEPVVAASASAPTSGDGSAPHGLLTWRSQRRRFATAALLAVVVVAAFLLVTVMPTAEITLVPRVATVGPLEVPVVASAATTQVDPERGAIPATTLEVPLEVKDTYSASGSETTQVPAVGTVVFSALDQEIGQVIPEGTRVKTIDEVAFLTTAEVTLPRSDGVTATVTAPVEALVPGEGGNVGAGEISLVPDLAGQGITVSNPEAMSGGLLESTPLVTAADYVAAEAELINRLNDDMRAYLRDPVGAPAGYTVYPGTATLGPVTLVPTEDEVVGVALARFELAGSATARVLAVDESAVDEVARARLSAAVPAGLVLLARTVEIGHGEGNADGDTVAYIGTAIGRATPAIDVEALTTQVAGLPVSEAQAILEVLGTATVSVWPGFLGDLPNDRERIRLDVLEASDTE